MPFENNFDFKAKKLHSPSLKIWEDKDFPEVNFKKNTSVYCGWGELIFGHTFVENEKIIEKLKREKENHRNICFYVQEPHVLISMSPHRVFLDPSHSYRLWFEKYSHHVDLPKDFLVRKASSDKDIKNLNLIYKKLNMPQLDEDFYTSKKRKKKSVTIFVAEKEGEIIGGAIGIDHLAAFRDVERGSSLWSLAVNPDISTPAIGINLLHNIINFFYAKGRSFLDLSVYHNNKAAISLYEKMGFERTSVFCLKTKNTLNRNLYTGQQIETDFSKYARVLIIEAQRRGIVVELLSEKNNFRLRLGGRKITCYETLTELTDSIAYRRCHDKNLTSAFLAEKKFPVPDQIRYESQRQAEKFINKHNLVVVKPACGEQGKGISLGISTIAQLQKALRKAGRFTTSKKDILIEQCVNGQHVRIVVIGFSFVSASIFHPPEILGTGKHSARQLIKKYNRRKLIATNGECKVPLDQETKEMLHKNKYSLDSVIPLGEKVILRRNTNEHTGGSVEYITEKIPDFFKKKAEKIAKVMNLPVVGFDFMIPDFDQKKFFLIEANERPRLETAYEAKKFVDLLFPETVVEKM